MVEYRQNFRDVGADAYYDRGFIDGVKAATLLAAAGCSSSDLALVLDLDDPDACQAVIAELRDTLNAGPAADFGREWPLSGFFGGHR